MKKTGIFGGTFDPPHNGHLAIAKYAYESLSLDRFIFIPNGTPAYKLVSHNVTDSKDRFNMIKLAIEDLSWCEVSDIEIIREGNTYTADTLSIWHDNNPQDEIYLIIGSDSFDYIDEWYRPDIIFKLSNVVVLMRDGDDLKKLLKKKSVFEDKYNTQIIFLDNELVNISSSELRKKISEEKIADINDMVPATVLEYILDNKLYS